MHPHFIDFNGYRYRLSGNYYRRNAWSSKGPSNLHRAVWEFHHGSIQKGCEIHHIDGDPFNNEIGNLACVDGREHQRNHTLERYANGELHAPTKYALQQAAKWHRSAAGIAWHKQHGPKSWLRREWHPCTCQECGQPFMSPFPTRAKFCHLNCKMAALRKRRGMRVRPDSRKPVVLSGKRNPGQQ